jgi:hypothetical protein
MTSLRVRMASSDSGGGCVFAFAGVRAPMEAPWSSELGIEEGWAPGGGDIVVRVEAEETRRAGSERDAGGTGPVRSRIQRLYSVPKDLLPGSGIYGWLAWHLS